MMITQEQILDFVRLKGPVLPIHIARETKLSMLFAGAYLAELTSSKKVLISKLVVGTSPLYYVAGQEAKLQNYSKYLENKEQEALNLLRETQILKDKLLEPVVRVALRNIPDFAIPVKVNLKTDSELFWKWYLIPNNDAEIMIRDFINQNMEEEKTINAGLLQQIPEPKQEIIEKKSEIQQKKIELIQEPNPVEKSQKIIKKKQLKTKKVVQKELIERATKPIQDNIDVNDPLFDKVKISFDEKSIIINSCEIITAGKELQLVIIIPTMIGNLPYFCKVKRKVRSTENDLFETMLAAQKKGLPGLFVSTGTINKKGKDLLNSQSATIQFLSIK